MADAPLSLATPGPRPVVQTSIVDQVIREVRRSVLDGSLPSGAPVSIAELATRLDVSHIPVREALRRLEGDGIIELRRSRSAVVAPLSRDDLDDVFRLRGLLEAEVYGRAVKLRTAEQIDELQAAYEDLTIRRDDDPERLGARHLHFHRLLAAPAASEWDWRLLEIMWQVNDRYLYLILGDQIASGPEAFREGHAALLRAAEAKSARDIRAATAAHLKEGQALIAPHVEPAPAR